MTTVQRQAHKRGGQIRALQQQVGKVVAFTYHKASDKGPTPGVVHTGQPDEYAGRVFKVFRSQAGDWLCTVACANRLNVETGAPEVRSFRIDRMELATVQHARPSGELTPVFKS